MGWDGNRYVVDDLTTSRVYIALNISQLLIFTTSYAANQILYCSAVSLQDCARDDVLRSFAPSTDAHSLPLASYRVTAAYSPHPHPLSLSTHQSLPVRHRTLFRTRAVTMAVPSKAEAMIDKLPAELTIDVMSYLRPHDLTQLARASKRYREFAQSALWTSVSSVTALHSGHILIPFTHRSNYIAKTPTMTASPFPTNSPQEPTWTTTCYIHGATAITTGWMPNTIPETSSFVLPSGRCMHLMANLKLGVVLSRSYDSLASFHLAHSSAAVQTGSFHCVSPSRSLERRR